MQIPLSTKPITKKRFFRLLVIGIILGVFSSVFLYGSGNISQDASQNRQNVLMAQKGEVLPFKMNMTSDVTLYLGNNKEVTSAEALVQGVNLANFLYLNGNFPFQIGFSDDKMSVSANITDSNNQLVATIRNNVWKSDSPNSPQIGDRNYNNYAFEVIDNNNITIFNVRVVGSNEIQIGGLFNLGGTQTLVSDNGGGILGSPSQQNITQLLTPLFKYPSSNYLGELVNPTYLRSLPTDTSDAMIFEASILTIIGFVLAGVSAVFLIVCEIVRENDDKKEEKANEKQPSVNNEPKRATKREKRRNRDRKGRKR
jgi:large-conductance mechanosensitive channel